MPRSIIKLVAFLLPLAVVVAVIGRVGIEARKPVSTVQSIHGRTMGTTYTVRYLPGPSTVTLDEVYQSVESELANVNQQMSTYIADSEISLFNSSSSTDWFGVSGDTAHIVQMAIELSQLSGGAFDITVGPAVDLWGFGPGEVSKRVPSEDEIATALAKIGYKKLQVRADPPALRKTVPDLRIDLSAIAKGHGADRVALVLKNMGIDNLFVEIGGEIATAGKRADGNEWQVGIEAPTDNERQIHSVLGLSNAAIATSGDYRNFFKAAGTRYAHTIDPATARPVQHELASASVVADNCALADGIATSMMALGPERAGQLAEREQWACMLVVRDKDRFVTKCTSAFKRRFPTFKIDSVENHSGSKFPVTKNAEVPN